jgi:hypothetical protein
VGFLVIFYIFFSAKLEKGFVKGIAGVSNVRFSSKVRGGRRVVAVFLFEVVEPFFSRAAAPQHIPS